MLRIFSFLKASKSLLPEISNIIFSYSYVKFSEGNPNFSTSNFVNGSPDN